MGDGNSIAMGILVVKHKPLVFASCLRKPLLFCLWGVTWTLAGCVSNDVDNPKLNVVVDGANTDPEAIARVQQQGQMVLDRSLPYDPSPLAGHSPGSSSLNTDFPGPVPAPLPGNPAADRYPVQATGDDTEIVRMDEPTLVFSDQLKLNLDIDLATTPTLQGPSVAGFIAGGDGQVCALLETSEGKTIIKKNGDEFVFDGQGYTVLAIGPAQVVLQKTSGDLFVIQK